MFASRRRHLSKHTSFSFPASLQNDSRVSTAAAVAFGSTRSLFFAAPSAAVSAAAADATSAILPASAAASLYAAAAAVLPPALLFLLLLSAAVCAAVAAGDGVWGFAVSFWGVAAASSFSSKRVSELFR